MLYAELSHLGGIELYALLSSEVTTIALETEADVLFDNFMTRIRAVDKVFDYGFYPSPEQKKEILNILVDKFILYRDGKIELRFKVPVNDEQVADKIQELSCDALVF